MGRRLRELFSDREDGPVDAPVPADLLQAAVQVLSQWDWAERPIAVVSMPSRRRPQLVRSFAEGIARIGQLPYLGELSVDGAGPITGPGGNSAYRLASVWEQYAVPEPLAEQLRSAPGSGRQGPVLLVDDLADSRWTLTVAGRALRRAGADGVLPLVLALVG